MHMADALLSPAVGIAGWVVSGIFVARSAARLTRGNQQDFATTARTPLMAVMGAFVFAAQMINFSIPGTGSSGHLGGGLLLAILLGPDAALIVITSILMAQALLFADGGLLALGCNIFNIGVISSQLVFPLLYRRLLGPKPSPRRFLIASMLTAEVGLLLGALAVVLETTASGVLSLPFGTFLLFMLPIHAAIAIAEGFVTSGVVRFLARVRPQALTLVSTTTTHEERGRSVLAAVGISALLTAGGLCWFASSRPDGLEWSIEQTAGTQAPAMQNSGLHRWLSALQLKTAWMPDYSLRGSQPELSKQQDARATSPLTPNPTPWPSVDTRTSAAGLLGVGATAGLVLLLSVTLKLVRRHRERAASRNRLLPS
jgi:cobalt/nickel transport system permease protein